MNETTNNDNDRRWQQMIEDGTVKVYIADYEGDEDHPYLDSKGIVTTGIGFNIDSNEAFSEIDWLYKEANGTMRSATPDEVAEGLRQMRAENKNRNGDFSERARAYKETTRLRISENAKQARFAREVEQRSAQIVRLGGRAAWDRMTPEARHGGAVLDDPLTLDGIAGPKTRQALRQAVASLGADGFIARL